MLAINDSILCSILPIKPSGINSIHVVRTQTPLTLCVVHIPPLSTTSNHSDLFSYFDLLLTPKKKDGHTWSFQLSWYKLGDIFRHLSSIQIFLWPHILKVQPQSVCLPPNPCQRKHPWHSLQQRSRSYPESNKHLIILESRLVWPPVHLL